MTLANTDLHLSHNWTPGEGGGAKTLFCSSCMACSCCVGSGATGNCIGVEGLEKEVAYERWN